MQMCVVVSAVYYIVLAMCLFLFKQKTAYDMRMSDWSSDVCSADLSPNHNFVIHIDHIKDNNSSENLKWVRHETQIEHALSDPNVLVRQNPAEAIGSARVG